MRIDGKAISGALRQEVAEAVARMERPPRLAIVIPQETFIVRKFVDIKKEFALAAGIECTEIKLGQLESENDLLQKIFHAGRDHDGIIVQLPLPPRISLENVLAIIPATHDVDVMGVTAYDEFMQGRFPLLPPVAGAVAEILKRAGYAVAGRTVAVVGEGRLVGAPTAHWARKSGGIVSVVTQRKGSLSDALAHADIVISGAGVPGIITPDLIKDGAILIDAGTSEAEGKLVGDVDPACEEKAALFTPTPGGVGPITVAMLFKNLLRLMHLKSGKPIEGIEGFDSL